MKSIVVSVATISTTNITGLRAIARGLSLMNAPWMAGRRMALSVMDALLRVLLMIFLSQNS